MNLQRNVNFLYLTIKIYSTNYMRSPNLNIIFWESLSKGLLKTVLTWLCSLDLCLATPCRLHSCKIRMWFFVLCFLVPSLDLETLPHMSQAWETPVIWFPSMWVGIFPYDACFPQTLQEAMYPCPFAFRTSVFVIIDLICSSRFWRPKMTCFSSTATTLPGFDCGW